jgi:hypothetical protein
MTAMIVDVEALNFRDAPSATSGTKIGSLFLTQKVDVLSDEHDGWARVKATVDGAPKEGFVAKRFLRAPVTRHREALVASVSREFMRFDRGLGKENVAPFSGFVGEMWRAIGVENLDGTDRDVPWSAAAISLMVRNAGAAYKKFKFAAAHSKFVHHAIQARAAEDTAVPFWGFRLNERRPQIGDIVARDNPEHGPVVTFDVAARLDDYRSHSDVVVRIDSEKQRLLAIGGNVGDSVSVAVYDLAPGDFLSDARHAFALLHNRTDE